MAVKVIPVVAAKIPSTQTNFPVYIKPSAMTGWGTLTLAEAQSTRWYSDSGLTTELAREIVSADEIHVKVPSLTTTTTLYCSYNGTDADYAVTATYGRNAVWSDYRAVYHLESLTADSTAQGYTLTNNGSVATTTGKVGGGGDTGATNTTEVLNFSDGTNNFLNFNSAHAISYWINFTTLPIGTDHDSQMMLFMFISPNFRRYGHRYQGTGGFGYELVTAGLVWSGDTVSAGTWNHITNTYDGTTLKMFLNGTEIDSRAHSFGTQYGGDNNLKRISIFGPNTTGEFCGKMDDVRIKQSSTSTTWITTEYNNQSSVSTFWGTVTDAGGGGYRFNPQISTFAGL